MNTLTHKWTTTKNKTKQKNTYTRTHPCTRKHTDTHPWNVWGLLVRTTNQSTHLNTQHLHTEQHNTPKMPYIFQILYRNIIYTRQGEISHPSVFPYIYYFQDHFDIMYSDIYSFITQLHKYRCWLTTNTMASSITIKINKSQLCFRQINSKGDRGGLFVSLMWDLSRGGGPQSCICLNCFLCLQMKCQTNWH